MDKIGGMSMEITKRKRITLIIVISLLAPLLNENLHNYSGIEFMVQYAILFAIALVLMWVLTW